MSREKSVHAKIPFEEAFREWDVILLECKLALTKETKAVSVVNPARMRDFVTREAYLRTYLRGKGIKIEAIPNDGYASVGVIRVSAKELWVKDPVLFAKMTCLASNYEVYPRVDGKLMFALTFYGMTRKAEV